MRIQFLKKIIVTYKQINQSLYGYIWHFIFNKSEIFLNDIKLFLIEIFLTYEKSKAI